MQEIGNTYDIISSELGGKQGTQAWPGTGVHPINHASFYPSSSMDNVTNEQGPAVNDASSTTKVHKLNELKNYSVINIENMIVLSMILRLEKENLTKKQRSEFLCPCWVASIPFACTMSY